MFSRVKSFVFERKNKQHFSPYRKMQNFMVVLDYFLKVAIDVWTIRVFSTLL